jgi:hypothetical protein
MEIQTDGHIPFLDTDVYRRPNNTLGHEVYMKLTHINLYLSATSPHHPVKKQTVLSTLVHSIKAFCDSNGTLQELKFLYQTNGTMETVNGTLSQLSIQVQESHNNAGRILLQGNS